MKFLLGLSVLSISFAVARSDDTVWTEESIQELFDNADSKEVAALTPEMITKNNYPVEVYYVTTEDNYILQMHRIPGSPTSPVAEGKPVVFLMHGLLCSSADWVVTGPGKGFGYLLADAGYDVWMGNARGNTYSRNHTSPKISQKKFWNFSWHEIGYYDLPAMIDFALEKTGLQQLSYIGHSQGTTTFFVLMSERPEYNDKINGMWALAPIAYVDDMYNPFFQTFAPATNLAKALGQLLGVYYVFASPSLIRTARAKFCGADVLSQTLCSNLIFLFGGYDAAQLNVTMLPIIFGHFPAGASLLQVAHYGQEIQSGKFRQYDHGWLKNLRTYGSLTPPDYDMSLVTVPVHLIYSDNDWLSAVKDVTQLNDELANPVEMRRVPYEKWSHFDFLWGNDAKELVYDDIMNDLDSEYSSS